MRVLLISNEIPSPLLPPCARAYYAIKYLSQKYNYRFTLLSRHALKETSKNLKEITKYCEATHIIEHPDIPPLSAKGVAYTVKNMLSPQNILSRVPSILDLEYSPKMKAMVKKLVRNEEYDVIYCNSFVACYYIYDVKLPKILEAQSIESLTHHQLFKQERNPLKKAVWLLQYYKYKRSEQNARIFNAWMCPTKYDACAFKSRLPELNITVIPPGVETEYFKPMNAEPVFPSLVFTGMMNVPKHVQAVLYFYNQIYPLVQREVPNIKLFIVGRNPAREIVRLTKDNSVEVTGFVKDVRRYLAQASIVIVPHLATTGLLTKVQEAMAMGKAIVSTSIGVRGIDVPLGNAVQVADDPQTFASKIVELVNDEQKRKMAELESLRLAAEFSWEKVTNDLNKLFYKVVKKN